MRSLEVAALVAAGAATCGAIGPGAAHRYRRFNTSGFAFLSEEYAPPQFDYGSDGGDAAFHGAVASLGASSVRLVRTLYADSLAATSVVARNGTVSPIRTASAAELKAIIGKAQAAGLAVTLSLAVDMNWDVLDFHPGQANTTVSQLGSTFSAAQWDAWFASYAVAVRETAGIAKAAGGVAVFDIASGLDVALSQGADRWAPVVAAARDVLPAPARISVSCGAACLQSVPWLRSVDLIGWTATPDLSGAANSSADAIEAAWKVPLDSVEAVSGAAGRPVLVTTLGFQSRPNAWKSPLRTARPDFSDCSGWLECYDMTVQARALEGSLRALARRAWVEGVFVYAVTTDPTSGGTSDDAATPMGKPAASVLQRWFGGALGEEDGVGEFPGTDAIVTWMAAHSGPAARPRKTDDWNGFVFGGPDEWSSPYYRYDTAGARASIDALAATGANTVQLVAMRYYESRNSTLLYAISDLGSTLRTTTGPELGAIIEYAKSKGLKTMISPMIDPDYDLPGNCRQCASPPGPGWRGLVGTDWGNDCSAGTPWAEWHDTYANTFILPLARLSQRHGADAFLVAHELQVAVQNCPDRWVELLASVRAAFAGKVSVAFNHPVVDHWHKSLPWINSLDFVGVDCYFATFVPTPGLPWQDGNLSDVAKAWEGPARQLGQLSAATGGKDIVCTEIGSQSRPWAYSTSTGPPGHEFTPQLCNVWDQCHSNTAQALYYEGMFQTLYANDWFKGFTLWMWRADPTSGGPSDDAFTPAGKPQTLAVLRKYWGA